MENDCIFCQIIHGKKPADWIYQGESVVAFKDKNPNAPHHILIVPTKHIRSINDLEHEDRPIVSEMIMRAGVIAKELGIDQTGYKLIYNVERGGGQFVFHLHLHLIGGW